MNFFKKIGLSIYSPTFYRELLDKPLKYSIKYFFGLILLSSLVSTIFWSATLLPGLNSFIRSVKGDVVKYYPEGLEVTIKSGKASTNVTEPYYVKGPQKEGLSPANQGTNEVENILVIDTTHDFSLTEFDEHKTMFLLTRDAIVSKNDNGKISIEPLSKVPDMTITRDAVSRWMDKIVPFLKVLPFLLPILILIGIYLSNIFTLVYFLLAALLVWICLKIKKVSGGYKKAYQITIHAYTFSLIAILVLGFFGVTLPFLVPTALLLIIALINVKKIAVV